MTHLYQPGDRIRFVITADDGLPLVQYGFVGSQLEPGGPVSIMLDGEIKGSVVPPEAVALVSVSTVELVLQGDDLMTDPVLRTGLIAMWCAEAENAGLAVDTVHPLGDGLPDGDDRWALARMMSGGLHYVVCVEHHDIDASVVRVHAVRPDSPDDTDASDER